MPLYEIEQYELHAQAFRVKAPSAAAAIKKVLNGWGHPMDQGTDLIEVCHDRGMSIRENRALAAKMRSLGVELGHGCIPSIRSVQQVE